MNGAALSIRGLDVWYGQIHALHGVDVDAEAGRITTLLGANGAGKTTLLRTISGLVKPRSGSIRIEGREIAGAEAHAIVRHGISQSPEGRQVFPNLTVKENLQLGAWVRTDRAGIAADLERVVKLWPRLGERFSQNAGTLSGGEQQMLAIGRAMMARPKVLLLDEPSLGLAPVVVAGIFETIQAINAEGTTVLLVEQNAHLALRIAHTAYVLETGHIERSGPAREMLDDDAIRAAYLGG
ncbi:MAG: ABC transporter ATP-binding protein [Myxococcota bacterium]